MALPADFSKIFGSTATGGLTPIGDVNYAKGWEFVGSNPPTKNDFSYLQNLSDLKSQWLYSNKLQRANPFGDIKSDNTVNTALTNLGLGDASGTVGRLLGKPRVYTSSSKYDDPTPGTKFVIVEVQGAGGSGANTGFTGSGEASIASGGSAGGYACSLLKIDQAINQIITVGAGGDINSGAPAGGRPGGTSSFGNLIICEGGSGGYGQARSTPPFSCTGVVGGTATGGNIINKSGDASTGGIAVGSSAILCGNGGSSKFGTGGFTPTNINTNGRAAIGYGAGGGGAISQSQPGAGNTGGAGSGGIIIIWEYA